MLFLIFVTKICKKIMSWVSVVSKNVHPFEKGNVPEPIVENAFCEETMLDALKRLQKDKKKPKIIVEGLYLSDFLEHVRRKLLNAFKYRSQDYKSFKNGFISVDELCKKLNCGPNTGSVILKSDIMSVFHSSHGKEFRFHPLNHDMVCHVQSKIFKDV